MWISRRLVLVLNRPKLVSGWIGSLRHSNCAVPRLVNKTYFHRFLDSKYFVRVVVKELVCFGKGESCNSYTKQAGTGLLSRFSRVLEYRVRSPCAVAATLPGCPRRPFCFSSVQYRCFVASISMGRAVGKWYGPMRCSSQLTNLAFEWWTFIVGGIGQSSKPAHRAWNYHGFPSTILNEELASFKDSHSFSSKDSSFTG